MDPKPWYASKTIWLNLLAFLAAATGAFGWDLGLNAETQSAIAIGLLAVINVVLRAVTARPVSVVRPPEPMA